MKYIILTLIVCFSILEIQGQDKPKIEFKKERGHLNKIEFVDSSSGRVVVFDPKLKNPFNNLSYPVAQERANGYKVYDLTKVPLKTARSHFRASSDSEEFQPGSMVTYYEYNYSKSLSNVVISYRLDMYNTAGEVKNSKTKVIVLNDKGEAIFSSEELEKGLSYPSITEDGKFLVMTYGGMNHDDYDKQGYVVMEVSNGLKVLENYAEEGYSMGRPFVKGNLIIVAETGFEQEKIKKYTIIKPDERVLYVKKYSLNQLKKNFREIGVNGFIFNVSGGIMIELYQDTFEVKMY